MTLQLRRTDDARYGRDFGDWWEPMELDTYELVERIEREFHPRWHGGPMEACPNRKCADWVDWLRHQGVIF